MEIEDARGLGPFFVIDKQSHQELYEAWARGREPRMSAPSVFARELTGMLEAVCRGNRPASRPGIALSRVLALAAEGRIEQTGIAPTGPLTLAERAAALMPGTPDGPGAAQASPASPGTHPAEELRSAHAARKKPSRGPSRGERLMDAVADPAAWGELLKTMAEHPGMSPRNLIAITEYRAAIGARTTQELLNEERIAALGGRLVPGAIGVTVNCPAPAPAASGSGSVARRYKAKRKYSPIECEGLDPKRHKGLPMRCDPDDPASMDRFLAATSKVDLDALDDVTSYVFSLRYGLSAPEGDPLPAPPAALSVEQLESELLEISDRAGRVCKKVDRALKLASARSLNLNGSAPAPDGGAQTPRAHAAERPAPSERRVTGDMTTAKLMDALAARDTAKAATGHGRMPIG